MQSQATTVDQYVAELAPDRRAAIETLRTLFRDNLDPDFEEGMQYGMIGYYVPHRIYSSGYHCDPRQPLPFAGIASQKNYMSLYLTCLYGNSQEDLRFRKAWAATGKRLDMGKCCIRFKKIEDLALDPIAQLLRKVRVETHVRQYENQRDANRSASAVRKNAKRPR